MLVMAQYMVPAATPCLAGAIRVLAQPGDLPVLRLLGTAAYNDADMSDRMRHAAVCPPSAR